MRSLITLTFLLILFNSAKAQGSRDTLYSNILKEKRIIEVILPAMYKPESNEKFDVMYLPDRRIISIVLSYSTRNSYSIK